MAARQVFDVHIEDGPMDELMLVNFPAMMSQLDNPPDQIQLSVKPKSLKFKLDVSLETNTSTYSIEQGFLLAKSNPKLFPQGLVDKNSFSSSRTPIQDDQLFVAKMVNDKLICRPVSNIITLRSDFTHLDIREDVDPKEEVKPISVKFAAPERQVSPTKVSARQQDLEESLEEYQIINFKSANSREANARRTKLFGQNQPEVKPDPDSEVEQKPRVACIPDIKPKIEKMDVDDIYSSELAGIQSSPTKSNQVKQHIRECLLKAKIVSFEEVYYYLRGRLGPEDTQQLNNKDILDALSEFAVLVQGNWAIKSEILYGDSSKRACTDVTSISINLFIAARDYLLWLFTQSRMVSRAEYSRRVRIPDHDILELFNQLAVFRANVKKWELKLPADDRFLKQFPDIVTRQTSLWKVRKANRLAIFLSS